MKRHEVQGNYKSVRQGKTAIGTHTNVALKKNEPSDAYTSTWTLDVVSSPVIRRGVLRRVISLRRRSRSHPRSQEESTRFRGMGIEMRRFRYHPLHSGSVAYIPKEVTPRYALSLQNLTLNLSKLLRAMTALAPFASEVSTKLPQNIIFIMIPD